MCRGISLPRWWILLVSTLSGQDSLMEMERFANHDRQTLNGLLGTDFGKTSSDSTFRLLLAQLDVPGLKHCYATR